jgi:hypothetical protein
MVGARARLDLVGLAVDVVGELRFGLGGLPGETV